MATKLTGRFSEAIRAATQKQIEMRSKESIKFFKQYTYKNLTSINTLNALTEVNETNIVNSKRGIVPGEIICFNYDPKYKDKNFVIIGFPANNFGKQEPGTNAEISTFCELNYGVTFPMMSKISVKGSDMHPLYQFLTQKSKNGLQDSEVEWNFQKYLINEKGELEQVIKPQTLPSDPSIAKWIQG